MSHPQHLIFRNGKIKTLSPGCPSADTLITSFDKILFVGSEKDAQSYSFPTATTEVIDLNGKLMLPGFIDSHAHIVMGGEFIRSVDLSQVNSKEEFRNKIGDFLVTFNGDWMKGGNWNHQNWESGELPTKEWIDDITGDVPVFLSRMDYHMALVNSKTLALAGITKNTIVPNGGEIVFDEMTGEPTGILKDKAMNLVSDHIPPMSIAEMEENVFEAMNEAKRFGVTSIHDIAYHDHLKIYQKLEREGKLTFRIYARPPLDYIHDMLRSDLYYGLGSDLLKVQSLKAFSDGSLGSQTAWFFDPYSDNPASTGLPMDVILDGSLNKNALLADANKFQLSIHAIGDRANYEMLGLCKRLNETNQQWDRRFRIEHAQHFRREDLKLFKNLNVIVSAQPYHLYDDGVWAESKIGADRMKTTYAFNTFIKNNIRVCFGSDWPVVTLDPLQGIYVSVTRQTKDGKNPEGLIPEEKISVEEAVKAYTIQGAYAAFEENIKGSLTPRKLADMVVLDHDIFEIPPEEIKDTKVVMTVFNGEVIYSLIN